MASGLTAGIEDGMSFEEFAKNCMLQFGACYYLRDTPNKEINLDDIKVDSYYFDDLNKTLDEIEDIEAAIDIFNNNVIEYYTIELSKEIKDSIKYYEKCISDKKSLKINYENMLKEIEKFNNIEETKNFKEFMITQITDSIRWDCTPGYEEKELENLKIKLTKLETEPKEFISKYLNNTLTRVKQNLDNTVKDINRSIKQIYENKSWIREVFTEIDNVTNKEN